MLTSRLPATIALLAALTGAGTLAACGSATNPTRPAVAPIRPATTTATGATGTTTQLPVGQLAALARRSLAGLGDVNVTSASVVATTRRAAENWLEPRSAQAGGSSTRAYLIVLRGRFACQSCTRPAGASAPRGNCFQLLWVPGTGVTDFGLTPSVPPGLNRLGRVVKIPLGRRGLPKAMPPPGLRHALTPSHGTPAVPRQALPTSPSRVAVPVVPAHGVEVEPPSMERGIPVH